MKRFGSWLTMFVTLAAGVAFAQGPPTPTGITRGGSVILLRSDGKLALGPTPAVESTTDNAQGSFAMID